MNLESQVCSVEPSKRLNELGIKQESLFYWKRWIPPKGSTYTEPEWRLSLGNSFLVEYEVISAFTVAELGEMLPDAININGEYLFIRLFKLINYEDHLIFGVDYKELGDSIDRIEDENEANARAKMLIYLLENNLINLSDIQ